MRRSKLDASDVVHVFFFVLFLKQDWQELLNSAFVQSERLTPPHDVGFHVTTLNMFVFSVLKFFFPQIQLRLT